MRWSRPPRTDPAAKFLKKEMHMKHRNILAKTMTTIALVFPCVVTMSLEAADEDKFAILERNHVLGI